jgi:phage tail sheath protein FI
VIDGTTLPKGIVAAISQVESWDFSGLTGADYDVNGAGLLLNLASQSAYIWLNVTDGANTQTDPAGTGTGVQVDILSADTATDIAAKIDAQLVIEALANVDSIANATGVLTVTYTAGAQTANGDAGTSASAFTVDTAGVAAIEIIALNDGDDGLAISDANAITAANEFANKAKLNVTLLMDGGRTTPAYQKALDTIAQSRQDCVAILSIPFSDENASDYITAILEYQNDELNLNSSYSAIYSPHLLISDRFNAREIFVSPDGYVAGSISLSSINFEIWFPAAGFKRGILNVLDTKRRYTDGELDILYDNNINPIRFFPGRGIVVWGQKTLQRRASALDRLNVRLLLIVIEPAIKEFLENFLFDLNEVGVRTIIESQLEDYLETIRARKGITDYDVVVDDTNNSAADVDANRLNVDIFIKPTRSIEEIPVRIVITPTGISFGDAAGAI